MTTRTTEESTTPELTTVPSTTTKMPPTQPQLTLPLALTTSTVTATTTKDDVYDFDEDLCEQSPGSPWCGSDRSEIGFVTLLNIALLLVLALID
uniref:Uncharacterized protein n=1 Tax=Panagrellus redivivus TaxID=6233 RepID=A0A7E4VWH0_PANRE